mgnify:CR=1 FL=1
MNISDKNLKEIKNIAKECGIDLKEFYEDIKFKGFNLQSWYDYFNEPPLESNENVETWRTFEKDFPNIPPENVQNLILEKCKYEDLFREIKDGNTSAKIRGIFRNLLEEIKALNIEKDKYGDVIKKWKNNKLEATDASFHNFDYDFLRILFEVYNFFILSDILFNRKRQNKSLNKLTRTE